MTFPQTPLPLHVDINPTGSSWVDVTGDVRGEQGISITRGQSAEGSQSQPSVCTMTLDNTSGNYTPGNPMGTYYPNLTRNTPLRVWVERTPYLELDGSSNCYIKTADHASLDITGDIDIRVDARLDKWRYAATDAPYALMWKTIGSGNISWELTLWSDRIYFIWTEDGTDEIFSVSSVPPPALGGDRLAVRVTLDVDNGSGGHTVTFYTSDTIDGSWTQLGDPFVGSGTTSIYASTAYLSVGNISTLSGRTRYDQFFAAELRDGIDGTEVANPDFTAQTAGDTSFDDAAGRTWTVVGSAEISIRDYRFWGELADTIPTADISGTDKTVAVTASGILRRLQQGSSPLMSPIYRGIIRLSPSPQAYWPMEDEEGAVSLAAASASTSPVTFLGAPTLASYTGFEPNKPIVVINNARLTGAVPSYTNTGEIQVRFLVYFPASGMANSDTVCSIYTGGTLERIDLQWTTGGGLRLLGYDSDGTLTHTGTTFAFGAIDKRWRLSIELTQNGADVDYGVWAINPSSDAGGGSGTFTTASMGRCTKIAINPNRDCATTLAVGHLTVETAVSGGLSSLAYELDAWNAELASTRITRLCDEESIACVAMRDYNSTSMGYQPQTDLVSVLRECETADGGILYEPRHALGVAYRSRRSMYSSSTTVELDCSASELSRQLAPTFDDSATRNDVTVSRPDGSSARFEDAASVSVVGRYNEAVSLNLYSDSLCEGHAEWRVHLGTVDGARFPQVSVNRARSQVAGDATLDQQILDLDIGDRIDVVNPGTWASYDDIKLIVIGINEYLSNFEHTITFNCRPYEPWNVGIYDDAGSRYDTTDSSLDTGIDTDDMSWSVDVNSGPLWVTDAGEFPLNVRIGGEVCTVSGISGTSSPQTFTISARSVNGVVKSHSAGASITLAAPVYYGL